MDRFLSPPSRRVLTLQRTHLSPSPMLDDGTSSVYSRPDQDDPLEKITFYDTVDTTRKPIPVEPDHVQRYFSSISRQHTPWRAPPPKDDYYLRQSFNPEKPLPSVPPMPPPRPSLWARFNFLPIWIRYSIIFVTLAILFTAIILATLAGLGRFPPGKAYQEAAPANSTGRGNSKWDMSGSGQGTYYDPSVGVGACGFTNQSTDLIAALNSIDYGIYPNPNLAPCCSQCITVTGPKGSVAVTIVDKCPNCSRGDIDLSPSAFAKIADISKGRVPITWGKC